MRNILSYVLVLPLMVSLACGLRNEVERIHKLGHLLDVNPADNGTLMQLVDYLNNPHPILRAQAASAIGNLGVKHSEILGDAVVPPLIARLRDDDAAVRRSAVLALGDYGRKAEPAVSGLVEILGNNKGADSGWFAADVLGDLGTAAIPAVQELTKSLDHRGTSGGIHEFIMAERAALALFKLSPFESKPTTDLLNRLNSLSGQSLSFVALAILKSQPKNTPASEALARVLTAEKYDPAAVTLQEIDKLPMTFFDLKALLPALKKCSQSPNQEVRELASKQLARFTADPKR